MKIGFVGAGKMAEAMLAAWIRKGQVSPSDVTAADVSEERRTHLRKRHGVLVSGDNREAAEADLVVLAVKPQHLQDALAALPAGGVSGRLVMSILAGKRLATLEAALPGARVVRVMPNLPCVVGEGMSAWCAGIGATAADRDTVVRLLGAFGRAVELPESQFDAVTALSGSGPAFLAWVLDCMTAAAVAEGLSAENASVLAGQTMLGTARLLIEQQLAPRALIQSVASAKGTTAAGLAILDASDAAAVLKRAIAAAAARSRELSS
jgi:pyrroline-5-carboxylate reductase